MSQNNAPVRHAVVPAAGRGTRFLPITKAIPKEMLPIVDRPSIDYIAAEAGDAGIDDMLFITRTGKEAIERHFDADPELEGELESAGKTELLDAANDYLKRPRMHTVRQGHPLGLGHAVAQARMFVRDDAFAVMLPDDVMHPASTQLRDMIAARNALGGSVVALLRVTPEQATAYGSAKVVEVPVPDGVDVEPGRLMRLDDVVEKPPLDQVLSEYAVVGRYVFDPAIFDILDNLEPGAGGEIQLTDAFRKLIDVPAEEGGGVHGIVIDDPRYDTGDKLGYLQANIELALEDPRFSGDLRSYLTDLLASED